MTNIQYELPTSAFCENDWNEWCNRKWLLQAITFSTPTKQPTSHSNARANANGSKRMHQIFFPLQLSQSKDSCVWMYLYATAVTAAVATNCSTPNYNIHVISKYASSKQECAMWNGEDMLLQHSRSISVFR